MKSHLLGLLFLMSCMTGLSKDHTILVGTYTNDGRSKGIYQFRFSDAPALKIQEPARLVAATPNPSFLAYSPKYDLVYATGDTGLAPSGNEGLLSVFSRKPGADGLFSRVGEARLGIKGAPCHVLLSPDNRAVLASHYNEGVSYSWPLDEKGLPGKLGSKQIHAGKLGPNAQRQERPHAHSFSVSPDGRFAFACDLGTDRVVRYSLNTAAGTISATSPDSFPLAAGQGPRHSKFSPDGRNFYVLNELAGSLSVFSYKPESGELLFLQNISSLPQGYQGENTSAEVQVHPSGRFVYASNRGPDSIAVFSRDQKTGLLRLVEIVSSGGGHPRHYALTPDGAFLLCANRDGNNVVLFRVNQDSGRLETTGLEVAIPCPVCVLPLP